jgi:uncharacterized membrane protein
MAAFFFACHAVFVKVGLKDSDPMSAALISSSINVIFLWTLTILFVPLQVFMHKGIIYLIIAGLLAPCLARVFMYTGIEKVGVSIAAPLRSTFPFFAVTPAILFLGERFTAFVGIAIVSTVLGVVLLSSSPSDNVRAPTQLRWEKKDLLFPFAAALFYGVSDFFRKIGMITVTSPVGGATILTTISLSFFAIIFALMKKKRSMTMGSRNALFFSLGGIFGSLGQISLLSALKKGDLIIVSPLVSTTPLFVLLLTYIFFKKSERITFRVVLGAISVVTGVVILTSMS